MGFHGLNATAVATVSTGACGALALTCTWAVSDAVDLKPMNLAPTTWCGGVGDRGGWRSRGGGPARLALPVVLHGPSSYIARFAALPVLIRALIPGYDSVPWHNLTFVRHNN